MHGTKRRSQANRFDDAPLFIAYVIQLGPAPARYLASYEGLCGYTTAIIAQQDSNLLLPLKYL